MDILPLSIPRVISLPVMLSAHPVRFLCWLGPVWRPRVPPVLWTTSGAVVHCLCTIKEVG